MNNGFENEATQILQLALDSEVEVLANYPTIHYYLAYLHEQAGNQKSAKASLAKASQISTDYCFPYRFESIAVYRKALEIDPTDAHAAYYLGNLLYDRQPETAIKYWEQATTSKPSLARAHRNLGWAYNQTLGDLDLSISAYENAIANDPSDPKFYFELDRLYAKNATNIQQRHRMLTENHEVVRERPDALMQEIQVLLLNQKSSKALEYLLNNFFPRQEGVDNLHDVYVDACLTEGLILMRENKYKEAMKYFKMADQYPENHQIGRQSAAEKDGQIFYYQGLCYEKLKQTSAAIESFQKVAAMEIDNPEYKFYQSMSYQKLGNRSHAFILAEEIQEDARNLLSEKNDVDFFSKFGEEQSDNIHRSNAHYFQALSHLIRGNQDDALENLKLASQLNPSNLWAGVHLRNK